ncbi:MAG: metallophosphoesterase [Burkholderiales bacterium]
MRVRVLSDLHIDFGGEADPAPAGEDVVVIAGDVCEGDRGLHWAARVFPDTPIVYVPGNHEYYGADHDSFRMAMREVAHAVAPGRLHVLDDRAITIGAIRFIGSTLWTDFRLYGDTPEAIARAKSACLRTMLDFRHIHVRDEGGTARLLEPDDTVLWHRRSRQFLGLCLASGAPRETVVVTHHGPHRRSVAPRFANDLTSAGFISDLGPLLGRAALWIHGHTHTSFDYVVGTTRVICNPRGYCSKDGKQCENQAFDWDYVAEI